MAQIKFEDIQNTTQGNNTQSPSVGFFSLKNDGDEAIVRIMHDSTDSFDIVSTHAINVGGRYRRVNCCRNPYDPVEICPLCGSGNPSQQRFYVHLIQYVRGEDGRITPEAKVWERSLAYATTIKNLIVEYGPLSHSIFKIKRNGAAGSMDTTYSIMYANPQMYPENVYSPVPNAFDGYTAIGNAVLDKSIQDLTYFALNGDFPPVAKTEQAPQQSGNIFVPYTPDTSAQVANSFRTGAATAPSGASSNRPTRYY